MYLYIHIHILFLYPFRPTPVSFNTSLEKLIEPVLVTLLTIFILLKTLMDYIRERIISNLIFSCYCFGFLLIIGSLGCVDSVAVLSHLELLAVSLNSYVSSIFLSFCVGKLFFIIFLLLLLLILIFFYF